MILTEKNVAKMLWIGVAITLQSFSTKSFRFDLGIYHTPLPVMVMMVIFFCLILFCLIRQGQVHKIQSYGSFIAICLLFLIWHLFSAMFTIGEWSIVLREVVKVGTGFFCLWLILVAFPREEAFLEFFWRVVLWGSMPFLLYLLYQSMITHNLFLVSDLEEATNRGPRNQLAWYIVMLFPYALFASLLSSKKWVTIIPLLILSVALIYAASRAAWLGGIASFLSLPIFLWKINRQRAFKSLLSMIAISSLLLAISAIIISSYGNAKEISRRALWFLHPEEVTEYNSYGSREERIQWALKGFSNCSPLTGCGLKYMGGDVHNDYAAILAELGLVGEGLFLGILFFVGIKCLKRPKKISPASWVSFSTRASFINLVILMNFNTTYTSPQNWFFLGLFLVAAEIEKRNYETTKLL